MGQESFSVGVKMEERRGQPCVDREIGVPGTGRASVEITTQRASQNFKNIKV